MAATIAAHWYEKELGSPTNEDAHSRFPFLRLPHKRRDTNNSQQRPTSSKSSKSFMRPSTSRSNAPSQHARSVRRQSISAQSMSAPAAAPPIMKQPPTKSRVGYWRKKLGVHFIPPLAYYGWGSPDEVKRVAKQSKPVTSVPPNVRTATTDEDLVDEHDADDMILLTQMRAPSALGGLTLVESRTDDDVDQWPLQDHGL